MNRRTRTGPLTLNRHGRYVGYMSYYIEGRCQWHSLPITIGPSTRTWRF